MSFLRTADKKQMKQRKRWQLFAESTANIFARVF